ncbi:hypothetical protein PG993_000851 [Apiospora rasikravindrae]|uniref:Uncharacterized protein n=1 Tax=Apiospora rasikravindrae TaxID=990691 RepID=A0ABR1UCI6_9PEZI
MPDMATDQAVSETVGQIIDEAGYEAVCEAINDDDVTRPESPREAPSPTLSGPQAAVDRPLVAQAPIPLLPRHRKLRCIDNDIKREKRSLSEFWEDTLESKESWDAEHETKRGRFAREISDAAAIKAEIGMEEGLKLEQKEQAGSPRPHGRRRLGPVFYHRRLRERLAKRDGVLHLQGHAVKEESEPRHEETAQQPSTEQPYIPRALAAVRHPGKDYGPSK